MTLFFNIFFTQLKTGVHRLNPNITNHPEIGSAGWFKDTTAWPEMGNDVRGERIRGIDVIITTAGKEGAAFQPCLFDPARNHAQQPQFDGWL